MQKVWVAGSATWNTLIQLERFPEPRTQTVFSRRCIETVGGTSAGKAFNLRKLGFEVTLHAQGADDEYGRRISERMSAAGIALWRELDPQGTERHVNLMDAQGGRISIYVAYATYQPTFDLSAAEAALATHDHVVLDIANYCRRLIPAAQRAGKRIWCDLHDWDGQNPHQEDFARAADYVVMSSDGTPDHRALMRRLAEMGKQLVVCTHGRDGATALTADGRWLEQPIAPGFERRDTNGAGDAFFSGLLWSHARGLAWEEALRAASVVAGMCVSSDELAHPELSPARLEAEYRRVYGCSLPAPAAS